MSGGAPVAVTGLGAVSGFGWGVAPFRRGLAAGVTAIVEFDRFEAAAYRTRVAAQAPAPGAAPSSRHAARATWADRFALAAAREALAAAGLPASLAGRAAGVFFGASTGGMFESEAYFAQLRGGAGAAISRLVGQPPSGPADAVARELAVGGPVLTVAAACASATLALGDALAAIRSGEVELALAGGSDSLCRLTYAGFNSLRAVDPRPCQPFRAARQGMSIGEGAGVLVLESGEHAARRGARPLAWLAGVGASCDAHHMTAPDPAGDGIARAVVAALADAGVTADDIDFVNLHGTGTPANDVAEAKMVGRIFGDRAPWIPATSTKSLVGHLLGAAGAIEAVATVLALLDGELHATAGDGAADPALGVDLVVGAPRSIRDARRALSTNLAFGGANAACVFARAERG
ncbi:MAG: beta-ketoacyl-[acyl-carrier-protein] synthase family protein [Thermoanaerobaculia bacterium]|nr:beta-ketoacyl-[acyl-carrier-protein] synthase family protein [Thermoanaerobaculia bacterium]